MPRDRRHMSGTVYAPSRWVPHVGGVGSSAQKKGRDGARFIPPLASGREPSSTPWPPAELGENLKRLEQPQAVCP